MLGAIGRDWSRLVVLGRAWRDWSRLVAIGRAGACLARLVVLRRAWRDWSRLVAIGRDWSRLVVLGRDWRVDSVAIGRAAACLRASIRSSDSLDSVAIGRAAACLRASILSRFGRDTQPTPNTRRKTQKSPIPQAKNRAKYYRKASRAIRLTLAPHVNTCASAQNALLGQARQWCIVMTMSHRRHIARYI